MSDDRCQAKFLTSAKYLTKLGRKMRVENMLRKQIP
jgi:hypothetical protein